MYVGERYTPFWSSWSAGPFSACRSWHSDVSMISFHTRHSGHTRWTSWTVLFCCTTESRYRSILSREKRNSYHCFHLFLPRSFPLSRHQFETFSQKRCLHFDIKMKIYSNRFALAKPKSHYGNVNVEYCLNINGPFSSTFATHQHTPTQRSGW